MPFVKIDLGTRVPGIARPMAERHQIKSPVSGAIAELQVTDNQSVSRGQVLLEIDARAINERFFSIQQSLQRSKDELADYQKLNEIFSAFPEGERERTSSAGKELEALGGKQYAAMFKTLVGINEYSGLLSELARADIGISDATARLVRARSLYEKGMMPMQDRDSAEYALKKLATERTITIQRSLGTWSAQSLTLAVQLDDLKRQYAEINIQRDQYRIASPISGATQGFLGLSVGSFVAAGQTLGEVSPDDVLIFEASVPSRDIGTIQIGQAARIQVDAYPYMIWGYLQGEVVTIAEDANPARQAPEFKVLVKPNARTLTLSSGTIGQLRKGMTATIHLSSGRHSLLRLLWGEMNRSLDPTGPLSVK